MPNIPKGLPTHLAPHFHKRTPNPTSASPSPVITTLPLNPSNLPQIPLPTAGYWQILNPPARDPKYPVVHFLEFQKPAYVQLPIGPHLGTLVDEHGTIATYVPTSRIVFEIPPPKLSKEVTDSLITFDIFLNVEGGKLVYYFPFWSGHANALQELGLNVSRNKHAAGNLAFSPINLFIGSSIGLGNSTVQPVHKGNFPSGSFPYVPSSGTWQILEEPTQDPQYQGIYFAKFQKPSYAQVSMSKDLEVLLDELETVCTIPTSRIVFEHSDLQISRSVIDLLLSQDIVINMSGGKFVHFFPTQINQAQALLDLGFLVSGDKNDGAKLAQALINFPTMKSLLSSNLPVSSTP